MDGREDNKDIVLLDSKLFIGAMELVTLDKDILSRVRAKVGLLEGSIVKGLAAGDTLNRREQERKPTQNQHKPTAWIVQ